MTEILRTERVSIGLESFADGRFVLRSTHDTDQPQPFEKTGWKLLWTRLDEPAILNCALSLISRATDDLWVASYIIEYKAIVQAVIEARRRGVEVFVVTGLRRGRDSRHEQSLDQLARADIPIRQREDAHAKMLLVDPLSPRPLSMVTSANFDRGSMERNPEWAFVLEDSQVARALATVLWRIFGDPANPGRPGYAQHLRHGRLNRSLSPPPDRHKRALEPLEQLTYSGPVPLWTLVDTRPLERAVIELCNRASTGSNVFMASYSLAGLQRSNSSVGTAIAAAVERGARVRLLTRPHDNLRLAHLRCCDEFLRIGVAIRGHRWLHAKGLVLDVQDAVAFSANLDEDIGLGGGFETGLKLTGAPARAFANGLECLWNAAPFELRREATPEQVDAVDTHLRTCDSVDACKELGELVLDCPPVAIRDVNQFDRMIEELELYEIRAGIVEGQALLQIRDRVWSCIALSHDHWRLVKPSPEISRSVCRRLRLVRDKEWQVRLLGAE